MPKTRSQGQQAKGEKVSAQRGELAILRQALLQYLDRVGKDVVPVDDHRAICRVKTVTCKRIVKGLLLSVVEMTVASVEQSPNDDAEMILARAKQLLRDKTDVVSWKGNVLSLDSAEAKRVKRDEEEIRRGGAIIDATTANLVDSYWEAAQGRRDKSKQEPEVPPLARQDAMPAKDEPAQPISAPLESAVEAPINATPVRAPRPCSSVSKREAAGILQKISIYIVDHRGDEQILKGSYAVLHRCWPMTR